MLTAEKICWARRRGVAIVPVIGKRMGKESMNDTKKLGNPLNRGQIETVLRLYFADYVGEIVSRWSLMDSLKAVPDEYTGMRSACKAPESFLL